MAPSSDRTSTATEKSFPIPSYITTRSSSFQNFFHTKFSPCPYARPHHLYCIRCSNSRPRSERHRYHLSLINITCHLLPTNLSPNGLSGSLHAQIPGLYKSQFRAYVIKRK